MLSSSDLQMSAIVRDSSADIVCVTVGLTSFIIVITAGHLVFIIAAGNFTVVVIFIVAATVHYVIISGIYIISFTIYSYDCTCIAFVSLLFNFPAKWSFSCLSFAIFAHDIMFLMMLHAWFVTVGEALSSDFRYSFNSFIGLALSEKGVESPFGELKMFWMFFGDISTI
ncbi:hypothetical protein BDB00DRAFT_789532 [Zychaea mexicana]|uniref:uncharacterized protein n=1 Tax=Zychaea mexicana TaxID=64656 RepID=UPI0022FDD178|nr:uncharacterized protein BDB00DRAFT_789532 [Zychaea mexicana]KAI9491548.1 hypothetical protein BDB00DRAFT_789532 [Zychaea mexicana]